MNSQLSTFMALSGLATANSHLTDPRPAWIWAEDGKSILWANPAGAAFFGVRSLSELADLSGLARAPARPHIMRIAASGPDDRDTTDRLRFYRGLRVMLLTCTCRRLELADGSSAALIVANDAPPVRDTALAGLVALVADADDSTAVLYDGKGAIVDMAGPLDAPGFDTVSTRLRSAKHAPVRAQLTFDDGDHAAMLLMLDTGHTLAVIAAEPVTAAVEAPPSPDPSPSAPAETALADARADHASGEDTLEGSAHGAGPVEDGAEELPAEIADTASDADAAPQPQRRKWGIAGGGLFGFASATRFLSGSGTQDRANADARIDAERAQAIADAAPGEAADAPTDERMDAELDVPAADADEPEASAVDEGVDEGLSLDRFAPDESAGEIPDQASDDTGETHATDDASADAADPDLHETAGETSADLDLDDDAGADGDTHADADADATAGFAFEARERPVRFAWKMDIDRRFTFLSAEFGEALGPEAADVVGLTWDEVCERFGIDGDGRVAAALQRRDTWSGRTVDWPVSGAALRVPVDMAALPAFDRNRIFEGFRGFGVCRTGDAKDDPEATGTQLHLRPSLDALTTADEAPGEEIGTQVTDLSDDALPESGAAKIEETAIDAARADEIRTEADAPDTDAPDDDLSETAFPVDPPGGETDDAGDEADIAGADGEADHAALAPGDTGDADDEAAAADDDGAVAPDGDDDATKTDDGPSVDALAGAAAAATLAAAGSGTRAASRDDEALAASRLSKPEREAFRKIAEALGGRSDTGDTRPVAEALPAGEHDASDLLAALDDAEADTAPFEAPDETADGTPDGEIAADADAGEAEDVRLDDTDGEPDGIDDDNAADDGEAAPAPVAPVPARPYLTLASNKDDPARRDDHRIDGEDTDTETDEAATSHAPPLPPTRAQRTSLLDRLPVGVAIIDGTDVEYANATLLNLLGYPDTEALSAAGGLEALFAEPEDWPATVPGKMSERTMRLQLADGGARPVKARLHTVPWKGGNALMMSLLDRHDPGQEAALDRLHEVQSALALAEARVSEMDAVLETATDGVLILDEDGLIVKVNRSAEALFNASRDEMVGVALVDYLAPESRRDAMDYLDGLARNGVASVLNDGREVIGQIRSGGLIPLFMTIGRVGQGDSGPHFCTVLRDITQWKTAEEELTDAKRQAENASSQKSDFLAKISHEIRTPLNAIIGFSEVMMEERFGPVGNDRYKGYLRDIHNSGSHIMSLINDLLDLSKIEAGKLELTFEAVSANDIIRECVALMQPQANRERVIIRASLPGSVPNIVADGRSVRQVILNLLSNAIKFNQPGGQVIVSSALEDSGEVILRVRDTGTGMSHKDLEAAMEPFRQLHTARHGGGTGLGLPLTKALVEANRASFRIDSEVNQGTLIEITFPPQRVLAE
ncbi:PAS domain-containing sensor histidine kinase [Stappia stellulata]|uniref:PAS domain-containing sensor histidine kinase n=1 Tax=Stappia stellulata TaxID=71235 RepID=UPI001CD727BC|nr:PAS domain-containing sensor histidine kinase [Stappia stellulata]MCA1243394.1 PAS domain-containing sensor histidine kinase [Stappia stellulata]